MTLRKQGNEMFKKQDYIKAIDFYNKSIHEDENDIRPYLNRSICHTKIENFKNALEDAEKAIQIDPTSSKAYYRKAVALTGMQNLKEAVKAIKKSHKLEPQNKEVLKMKGNLEKALREQLFIEAIHNEETEQQYNVLNWKNITTKEGFNLDDDKPITPEVALQIFEEIKKTGAEKKCLISKRTVMRIVEEGKEILKKRQTLQYIDTKGKKMTVVGDVHGQLFDLINLFNLNGLPEDNHIYLFNGDFVDRGSFGVECFITLLSFMIAYPNSLYLARGNHETAGMNSVYGFSGEVRTKFGNDAYDYFLDCFTYLPYCHVINNSIFVVHGGIPIYPITLGKISEIKRQAVINEGTIENALLWADPQTSNGSTPSARGSGYSFGPDITMRFLNDNNLKKIIRSHEMKMNGYEYCVNEHLLTLFSAPNYCDCMHNKGAYCNISFKNIENEIEPQLELNTFDAVPHPPLPAMAYASFSF